MPSTALSRALRRIEGTLNPFFLLAQLAVQARDSEGAANLSYPLAVAIQRLEEVFADLAGALQRGEPFLNYDHPGDALNMYVDLWIPLVGLGLDVGEAVLAPGGEEWMSHSAGAWPMSRSVHGSFCSLDEQLKAVLDQFDREREPGASA